MLRFLSKFFVQIWLKSGRLCLLRLGADLLQLIRADIHLQQQTLPVKSENLTEKVFAQYNVFI
jgi:hypothetical protein